MENLGNSGKSPKFDPDRIIEILHEYDVVFVLVGGLAARWHGAQRATGDVDCIPEPGVENLQRLAQAMKRLNARLRVAGLTDEEAKQLPLKLDAHTLMSFGGSTWTTDSGPLDILVELRDRSGRAVRFDELERRAVIVRVGSVAVRLAALHDIVEAKSFAGRAKDLEALPELRRLLQHYDRGE